VTLPLAGVQVSMDDAFLMGCFHALSNLAQTSRASSTGSEMIYRLSFYPVFSG